MEILLAEDEEVTAAALRGIITALGYHVTLVDDGASAWRAFQASHAPIVISDWMMPGMDGPSLCRKVRSMTDAPYTYFILLSARNGRADRMEGLRAGADDFLVKPCDQEDLAVRLEIARRILSIQERLQKQNTLLAELATTDDLTGLANRREFRRMLELNFALARRQGAPLSLMFADIDHFKAFNDAFGHPAGDEALRTFARAINPVCREHEPVFRCGGEEFAVVLLGASRDGAMIAAERTRSALSLQPWPHRSISASFGIATIRPEMASIDELVNQADAALYVSKRLGRDRVTHYDDIPSQLEVSHPLENGETDCLHAYRLSLLGAVRLVKSVVDLPALSFSLGRLKDFLAPQVEA